MNRRTLLASVGTAATAVLAGCVPFSSSETETPEYRWELSVQNDHDRSYEVRIEVTDADGTAVFDQSFTLGPGEGRGFSDDFPPGEYTVTVTLPDRSALRSYWSTDQCDVHRVRTEIAADGHVSHAVACHAEGTNPMPMGGRPPAESG